MSFFLLITYLSLTIFSIKKTLYELFSSIACSLLAEFSIKRTFVTQYELFIANYMSFNCPIVYQRSFVTPYKLSSGLFSIKKLCCPI